MPLKVLDENSWSQTIWGEIIGKHDNLKELKPGQTMSASESWPQFDKGTLEQIRKLEIQEAKSPPRWGENARS